MSEDYSTNKEFLTTIYKVENLAKNEDFSRSFSIREYIISVGKQGGSSQNDSEDLEWFSIYNTQQEIRYEVFYKKTLDKNLVLMELYKWSDLENVSLLDEEIEKTVGVRILIEIKNKVEQITLLQSDRTLQA